MHRHLVVTCHHVQLRWSPYLGIGGAASTHCLFALAKHVQLGSCEVRERTVARHNCQQRRRYVVVYLVVLRSCHMWIGALALVGLALALRCACGRRVWCVTACAVHCGQWGVPMAGPWPGPVPDPEAETGVRSAERETETEELQRQSQRKDLFTQREPRA